MKKLLLFLLPVLVLTACNKDIGKVTVTYQKATPVYQSIDEFSHRMTLGQAKA